MHRFRGVIVLLAAAAWLGGCGGASDGTGPGVAAAVDASDAAGQKHLHATTALTDLAPRILNPVEELVEFAPDGILRWSATAGADAYEVWAYDDAGLTVMVEFSKALTSRQYQFTQLASGHTYHVKLYFRAGGDWKAAPTFTIKTATSVTKARLTNSQEELDAFGVGGTLRWTRVQGADVYELWVYRDATLVAFAEASGPVRITQYQLGSLEPGRTYYVQVHARVNGAYTAGGALPITITDQLVRARIVNPQDELDDFATDGLLRWTPVSGAAAYEAWIFTNPNSSEAFESSGSLTARAYATRTLRPGSTYYAQIYALVNGQWQVGAPVRISTGTRPTKARLKTPQEELEAFSTTGTLTWTEVPGADSYELWIFSNAGLGQVVESGTGSNRSYSIKHLCSGATYYVQVYAHVGGEWTTGWATRLDVTRGTSPTDCTPPAPVVTLTADTGEVMSQGRVTLAWTTKFATSCSASDAWSGSKGTSGQETVGSITAQSLFTLTCTGASGTYRAQVLVTTNTGGGGTTTIPGLVTRSATIPIDIAIVSNAADPFGGNAAGTAVLDFDGDGLRDLMITPSYLNARPELPVILLRNSLSGFVDGRSAFAGGAPNTGVARTPLIADFNGDGRQDYFAADHGLEVVENGTFIKSANRLFQSTTSGLSATTLPTVAFNHGACLGDIDQDGRPDAIVTPLSTPKVYALLNRSTGWVLDQSRLPMELTQFGTPDFSPSSCLLVDVSGDGIPDLVASGYRDGVAAGSPGAPYATGTRIFRNDGTGHFQASTSTLPRPGGEDWGSTSIRSADFDGDGRSDLLIAYELPGNRFALQLRAQTSPGTFADHTAAALGGYETDIGFWRETDVGDFNGDGRPDIFLRRLGNFAALGTGETLRRSLLLNNGDGTLSRATRNIELTGTTEPVFLVPLSIDGTSTTFVGYEVTGDGSAYRSLVPVTIRLTFGQRS